MGLNTGGFPMTKEPRVLDIICFRPYFPQVSPGPHAPIFSFLFSKILLILLILYVRSRLKEQGPPPEPPSAGEQQADNQAAADEQKESMSSPSPPTSQSSTLSRQQMDKPSGETPALPRESKKKSSRSSKKKQRESSSNDLPSPGYRDSAMSDRSEDIERRAESRTSGLARTSDSGVATDYATDSPIPSNHKQSRTSIRGMRDHTSSDAYRKSAGQRLTQQQDRRNSADEGRMGDPRSRNSRYRGDSRRSDNELTQEDDDLSQGLGGGSSVTTERDSTGQQHQNQRLQRQQASPPSSSSSQRRTRSRDARRKRSSREQELLQPSGGAGSSSSSSSTNASSSAQRPASREIQDASLNKSSTIPQEKCADKGLAFKDGLMFGPKNTALPDKFTSGPLLEQLGLDEDDIRKFMKAYGEYNKIMAKENRPGFDLPADFGAMFDCRRLGQQESGGSEAAEAPPSPPLDNQGPIPEATEEEHPRDELLQNNIKCDPPEPERTLKDLVGKSVDKAGNILDDEGSVIGKVNPDLSYLEGKTVTENGDIVDEFGKIYGKAEVVAGQKAADKKSKKPGSTFRVGSGDDDLIVNVDAHKGGISFSIHIPRPK